jgi:hypothetical protein
MSAKTAARDDGAKNTPVRGHPSHHESSAVDGERRAQTVDNVLERWRHGVVKQGLDSEIGASNAVLRAALALRRMQAEAAQRTQAAHEQAHERLGSARSVAEVASLGLALAQSDAQGALRYWSETMNIAMRSLVEGWSEAMGAFARAQGLAGETSRHWIDTTGRRGAAAESAEAESSSATPPLAAAFWPTQETVRDAMNLGARTWNDWLSAMPSAAAWDPSSARH